MTPHSVADAALSTEELVTECDRLLTAMETRLTRAQDAVVGAAARWQPLAEVTTIAPTFQVRLLALSSVTPEIDVERLHRRARRIADQFGKLESQVYVPGNPRHSSRARLETLMGITAGSARKMERRKPIGGHIDPSAHDEQSGDPKLTGAS